jgi:hypothetical protein
MHQVHPINALGGRAYCKIPDTGIESTFTGSYVAPTGLKMHALARYCKEE